MIGAKTSVGIVDLRPKLVRGLSQAFNMWLFIICLISFVVGVTLQNELVEFIVTLMMFIVLLDSVQREAIRPFPNMLDLVQICDSPRPDLPLVTSEALRKAKLFVREKDLCFPSLCARLELGYNMVEATCNLLESALF